MYKSIKEFTGSKIYASACIIPYSFISRQHYYWQECAEYSLLLSILPWLIYYFLRVIKEKSKKSIILFVVFCVLTVYSQYGGAFPVLSLAFCVFLYVLLLKNKQLLKTVIYTYGIAAVAFALPLYIFFLKYQMGKQNREIEHFSLRTAVKEFFPKFIDVFKWNLIGEIQTSGEYILIFLLLVVLLFSVLYLIHGKKTEFKLLFISNTISWLLFYISVKTTIYGYGGTGQLGWGGFGSRYNLFFIPCWFNFIMLTLYEISEVLSNFKKTSFRYIYFGICTIIFVFYSVNGWNEIEKGWTKLGVRDAVNAWIENKCYESYTFVFYCTRQGAYYYLSQNGDYLEKYEDRIYFGQPWHRHSSLEVYREDFMRAYPDGIPNDLYILVDYNYNDDLNAMTSVLEQDGYKRVDIFNSNQSKLVHMYIP